MSFTIRLILKIRTGSHEEMEFEMSKLKKLSPPQAIAISFAALIFFGALLLWLPFSSKSGQSISFLDALFTAVSSSCVTGLVVVHTYAHWTWFGKLIILTLIQFGALGFLTIMMLTLILLHQKLSFKNRLLIRASFNQGEIGGMARLVKNIMSITFAIETIGALFLAFAFYLNTSMKPFEALYQGIFHSVSAFCNAGFDNLGTESLLPFQSNILINIIVIFLIVAGGLGFTVWTEIFKMLKNAVGRSFHLYIKHLSLHSKLVLTFTTLLIFMGTLFFCLFEWHNPETLGKLPCYQKITTALFQSVTLRTAGFYNINQTGLTEISKFFSCILMLIGASPASTAGGMKTVTLGIIIFTMISALNGRDRTEAFGRTIPIDLLQKALTVACTMLIVVFGATFILHFTEKNSAFSHRFSDLLFEACSATGTVGVTTGITPFLSKLGKVVIMLCMFLGRLSPVTLVVALNIKLQANDNNTKYPDERVVIG